MSVGTVDLWSLGSPTSANVNLHLQHLPMASITASAPPQVISQILVSHSVSVLHVCRSQWALCCWENPVLSGLTGGRAQVVVSGGERLEIQRKPPPLLCHPSHLLCGLVLMRPQTAISTVLDEILPFSPICENHSYLWMSPRDPGYGPKHAVVRAVILEQEGHTAFSFRHSHWGNKDSRACLRGPRAGNTIGEKTARAAVTGGSDG